MKQGHDNSAREKVISAFKGVINSYTLLPPLDSRKLERTHDSLYRFFRRGEDELELYYNKRQWKILISLVDRLFPGQVDQSLAFELLANSLEKWIRGNNDPNDQELLEKAGCAYIAEMESHIQPLVVYIPVEGLEIHANDGLALGNCTLYGNYQSSKFYRLLEQHKARYPISQNEEAYFKRVTAFFEYEVTAHSQKAIQRGIEEAELALSILRLYLSSYHFHEYQEGPVYRMGLAGSLHLDEQLSVFYVKPDISIDEQFPGFRGQRRLHRLLEIGTDSLEYMQENGLGRINGLLQSLDLERKGDDLAQRMYRAITWFARATYASGNDSYLMYALAVEGLLSTGRTSQETYATQMATLIGGAGDEIIFPAGGYTTSEFGKRLRQMQRDRHDLIRSRIKELFKHRNDIAHGKVFNQEVIEGDLLDFETIVRNSILSFAVNNWGSLEAFNATLPD